MVWPTLGSRTAEEQNGTEHCNSCSNEFSDLYNYAYCACYNFFHLVVILGLLFRIVNVTFVILRTSSNDYFAIFGEPPLLIGICRSKMRREILNSVNTIRYDTRCYFNVRSKANMSQLNLPHGTDN